MFLSHWIETLGVDEILAPKSENDAQQASADEPEEHPIWEIIAPRSSPAGKVAKPSNGHSPYDNRKEDLVECRHCHKLTPVHPQTPGTASPPPSAAPPQSTPTDTPESESILHQQIARLREQNKSQEKILLAATGAIQTIYDTTTWEQIHSLFEACTLPLKSRAPSAYNPEEPSKKIKKIQRIVKKNADLLKCRSGNMSALEGLPDGFTVLHASCYGGNAEVVSYLLQEYILRDSEETMLDLDDRDMYGRTALHLASLKGHVDIIEMLKGAYEQLGLEEATAALGGMTMSQDATTKPDAPKTPNVKTKRSKPDKSPAFSGRNAPVDLAGRTPLALASTSPVPKAKQNASRMEKLLYGKGGDPCISGEYTPPKERCGGRSRAFSPRPGRTSPAGYLSPAPKKSGRKPPTTCGTEYGTPFSSPPPAADASADGNGIQWGASEKPGWRIDMEDATLSHYPLPVPVCPSSLPDATVPSLGLFGVFDGHADGGFASRFVSSRLLEKLTSHPQWPKAYHSVDSDTNSSTEGDGAMMKLIQESFLELDEDLKKEPSRVKGGGTTAIVAVVTGSKIFVANVGDSRCILVKRREGQKKKEEWDSDALEVIPLSEDHKPELPSERARIEAAGMTIRADRIEDESGPSVIYKIKKSDNEALSMARAFGDFDYKDNEALSPSRQAVICTPETVVRERRVEEDMYLVLACDGIWDVMTNDEVGLFVSRRVDEYCANGLVLGSDEEEEDGSLGSSAEVLARVGDDLLDLCLKKGTRDNCSVLIVSLTALELGDEACSSEVGRANATLDEGKRLVF